MRDDPRFSSPVTRESLLAALRSLNTASKEWVIRQYDHEVQGGSVIKPLVGPGQGPSDAAVIRPVLGSNKGIAIGNGICPDMSDLDPYWMAVAAIDEAIRNVVCVGGDPRRTAILDNFCWGNCDDPQNMGALVRAAQACYDAAMAYGTPFISGKDSLNNEFAIDPADAKRLAGRIPLINNRIRIPGTLLVSAISMIDDVNQCVTMDLKPDENSRLYFVATRERAWGEGGVHALGCSSLLHEVVAKLIVSGRIIAAHDVSDGGIFGALAEMALGGYCGARIRADFPLNPAAPVSSGYIIQASTQIGEPPSELTWLELGRAQVKPQLDITGGTAEVLTLSLADVAAAWREPLNW